MNELVFTRVLDAPRELVFDAWTDAKHIGHWWGPEAFTTTTSTMEVEVGGVWEYVMHGPDGTDYPNKSIYSVVDRPNRLVFSNVGGRIDDPHLSCEMHVSFEENNGKTTLTLRMVFASAQAVQRAEALGAVTGGWQCFARLAEFVSSDLRPPPST